MHPLFRHLPPPGRDYTRHTRSTVMFQGDFLVTLEELVTHIDEIITTYDGELFTIDSVLSNSHNIKIRLTHHESNEEIILNYVFRHRPKDAKYGHLDIDLTLSGFGKKSEYIYIGKFDILNRDVMIPEVLKGMIEGIQKYGV